MEDVEIKEELSEETEPLTTEKNEEDEYGIYLSQEEKTMTGSNPLTYVEGEDYLLEVNHLKVRFEVLGGEVKAVDDVSFAIKPGETLGLVGESGCGKTTTAFTVTRLLPANGKIVDGYIKYKGKVIAEKDPEITGLFKDRKRRKLYKEKEAMMAPIRWKEISMIFQSAMNAFNPVHKIGDQIVEAILAHEDVTKEEAMDRAKELFKLVGLPPARVTGYPHEFSGGMRQRAMIAMALACNPSLLIADEPTTALDVIMQDRILAEIKRLQKKFGIAMIIITHDVSVVAETADKMLVMYAGKMMEYGEIGELFHHPAHPYTIGLLASFPSIKGEKKKLKSIPGSPPDLVNPPSGCRFHPRCKYAKPICMEEEPPLIEVAPGHWAACHFAREIYSGELKEE